MRNKATLRKGKQGSMYVLTLTLGHRMKNPPLRIGAPCWWSSYRFAFWTSQSVWPKRTSSRESNVTQSEAGRPLMAGRSSVIISQNIYLCFKPIVIIWCHWLEEKSWYQRAKKCASWNQQKMAQLFPTPCLEELVHMVHLQSLQELTCPIMGRDVLIWHKTPQISKVSLAMLTDLEYSQVS